VHIMFSFITSSELSGDLNNDMANTPENLP